MKKLIILTALLSCGILNGSWLSPKPAKMTKNKKAVIASIEKHKSELINLSDKIWKYAETAFEETNSAKALSDYAESKGFRVKRGLAEMPTAFTAEYGSGKPIIGILGEFDALPALSQKAQSEKEPLEKGKPGHGCGHNLFGVASFGAALAIKELMDAGKIKGTVRFYGTPAEEKFFGKVFMARAGLFNDLDVCMDWHPSAKTEASVQSSKALVDFHVEFYGSAAHASADPWNGRSATDGMELFTTGLNYLREHVKPTVRMHYHIQHGGDVVNVVPEYSRVFTRVRDSKMEGVNHVYERVKKIAEGAAMMAEVKYKISLISGIYEIIPNRTGGAKMQANLELLGDIKYTEEEQAFGKAIQKATGKPEIGMDAKIRPLLPTAEHPAGGSTDVGDVSYIVPVIRMTATTAPKDTPWHSWAVVACGGMSIGHKGMVYAAKSLSMTMVDLFESPKLIKEVKAEHKKRVGNQVYKAVAPDGPPPIPAH